MTTPNSEFRIPHSPTMAEADELVAITVSSINTAKANKK